MSRIDVYALGWAGLVAALGCVGEPAIHDPSPTRPADAATVPVDANSTDGATPAFDGASPDGSGQSVTAGCGRDVEAAIFAATFEGGDFSEVVNVHADSGAEVDVVDAPAGGEGKAVRFSITPSHERAELRVHRVGELASYYYDWLVYLPADWQPAEGKSDIITQWHRGGGIPEFAKGNPMVLAVRDDGGYVLTYSFLSNPDDVSTRVNEGTELPRNAFEDLGRWVRWGLYANWSVDSDGELRVYHDCELVFEHHGANWLPMVATPMWKAGIYTGDPGWSGPEVYTLYEDDLRVFDE